MASQSQPSHIFELESLVQRALVVTKKARKYRKNLTSDNFYATSLAKYRAEAVNKFRDLIPQSAGDTSALAELIETVFAAETTQDQRTKASKDLIYALRTTWRTQLAPQSSEERVALFPPGLLSQTKRGYLMTVGRQMNECCSAGWCDASLVMMRRLLEIAIIEAFESNNVAAKIKGTDGNYMYLSDLITQALSEPSWTLSRSARKFLPQLKEVGDLSAHGRYFTAQPDDIERARQGCRVVLEEFLHHAKLL